MKDVLTPKEIGLMPMSVWLLTYECGTRFLMDYLGGDVYFKIHRENHNLDRARNQFALCREMAQKEDEMKYIDLKTSTYYTNNEYIRVEKKRLYACYNNLIWCSKW